MNCHCGENKKYESCCGRYIDKADLPSTAEKLMRSRFTSYVLENVKYIEETTYPEYRNRYDFKDLEEWAKNNNWHKLEIINCKKGKIKDSEGWVEFKAYYSDEKADIHVHHEFSYFKKEGDRWFFCEGENLG